MQSVGDPGGDGQFAAEKSSRIRIGQSCPVCEVFKGQAGLAQQRRDAVSRWGLTDATEKIKNAGDIVKKATPLVPKANTTCTAD